MTRKRSCVVREEAAGAGPAMVPRHRPTSSNDVQKVLNSVQAWNPGFSVIYHYTTFGLFRTFRAKPCRRYGLSFLRPL